MTFGLHVNGARLVCSVKGLLRVGLVDAEPLIPSVADVFLVRANFIVHVESLRVTPHTAR